MSYDIYLAKAEEEEKIKHPVATADERTHASHRDRMRKRVLEHGADYLYNHELLEVLLYYCIPRTDTNPIAHRLLERFGGLHQVFEADTQALCEVEGVGESTAIYLRMMHEVFRRYQLDMYATMSNRVRVHTRERMGQYFVGKLKEYQHEVMAMACIDGQSRVIHFEVLEQGTPNATDVRAWRIAKVAMDHKAAVVAIGHNHPRGFVMPSGADVMATRMLWENLQRIGVFLGEHAIVSGTEYLLMSEFGVFDEPEG